MKLQTLLFKVFDKSLTYGYRLFGRDRISLAHVTSRKDLKEIGTKYGGWVVPERLVDADSVCYCVGCGEDISFDIGIMDRFGCEIFAFDPTPRAIEYVDKVAGENKNYHFFELGLWDTEDTLKFYVPRNPAHVSHSLLNLQGTEEYIRVKVDRLSNIMKVNQHEKIDLLKLDIEGAEYKVIESILEDCLDIKIICVEYDECFNLIDKRYKFRIRASVNSLLANGYTLVCAQGYGNYTFIKSA